MRKILIFLCSLMLAAIIGSQVAGYIKYKTEKASPFEPDSSFDNGITTLSITAVGDCFFGSDINSMGGGSFNAELKNNNNDFSYFFKKVKNYFENDDLTIINYEGCISDKGTRQDKEYAFRSDPDFIKILTTSSVEAANLANNHSRDYGEVAFADTKDIMSENGIIWFEGKNFFIAEKNGIKVGLIGTNALRYADRTDFTKNLEELKSLNPDLIVACFHWGEESAVSPDELQKQLAHTAIDNGADLIIGHHPHVLQGIEKYKGKYIVYSLGNFSFGGNRNPSDKDTMIFRQTFFFKDGKLADKENVSVVPCSVSSVKDRNNFQPVPLSGKEFERVKEKIIERSKDFEGIENVNFIKNKE